MLVKHYEQVLVKHRSRCWCGEADGAGVGEAGGSRPW